MWLWSGDIAWPGIQENHHLHHFPVNNQVSVQMCVLSADVDNCNFALKYTLSLTPNKLTILIALSPLI